MLLLERQAWRRDGAMFVKLPKFACMHGHFRDDLRLTPIVVGHALRGFEINLLEPNLTPPITTGPQAREYEGRVREHFKELGHEQHRLVMTIYLTAETTAEMVEEAYRMGIRVAKLYYKVTTNSEHGVAHWQGARVAIAAMERLSKWYPQAPMCLQVHAEALGPAHHEREASCIKDMEDLVAAYPGLPVAIEHVSSRAMLEFVAAHGQVGTSITLHHLILTWNDDCVFDGCLDGHRFCAPVVKTEDDRQALLQAALGMVPQLRGRVWLGLDFAPHALEFKDGDWSWPPKDGKLPRMGMYTLDVAVPMLVALFERYGDAEWQEALTCFASTNGPDWYRIPPPTGTMVVKREGWRVPEVYTDAADVPVLRSFVAGMWLEWQVSEASF